MPFTQRQRVHHRGTRTARGFALLQAIVLVAAFGILATTILVLSSKESDAVSSKRKYDQAVSCADAAREFLHAQFSTFGASPTTLTLNSVVNDQQMASGHYDNLAVASVEAATGVGSIGFGATDISNRTSSTMLGGQTYRMTVVCSSTAPGNKVAARQSEVEFLVKFGL